MQLIRGAEVAAAAAAAWACGLEAAAGAVEAAGPVAMGPGPGLWVAAPHIRWSLIGATSSRSSMPMMDRISAAPTATCRFTCAHSASLR